MQAKKCLGFDLLVRRQVESNICQNFDIDKEDLEQTVNSYSNCFYVPLLIVYNILEKVFFKRFLNSSLYKKYINEIMFNSNIINEPVKANKVQVKKLGKKENVLKEEPLWVRPQDGNLQLGKINSNGRYISILNDAKHDYLQQDIQSYKENDDAWDLDKNELENFSIESNRFENRMKQKLEKLISKISLNGLGSNFNKNLAEDEEMAERAAAILVKDVIEANKII